MSLAPLLMPPRPPLHAFAAMAPPSRSASCSFRRPRARWPQPDPSAGSGWVALIRCGDLLVLIHQSDCFSLEPIHLLSDLTQPVALVSAVVAGLDAYVRPPPDHYDLAFAGALVLPGLFHLPCRARTASFTLCFPVVTGA